MATKGMGTQLTRTAPARGSALVGALQQRAAGESAVSIRLDAIASNPANPPERESGDLAELAESIREVGIVQALTVVPAADWLAKHPHHAEEVGQAEYVMLAGHRRRAAAASVGQTHAPVLVRPDLADRGASDVQLHENLHRLALTPIQEALAFQAKVDEGYSQRQIAAAVKVSQGQVAKRLALLKLPDSLQVAVDQGWYTVAHMLDVLKLDDAIVAKVARSVEALIDPAKLAAVEGEEAGLDLSPSEARARRSGELTYNFELRTLINRAEEEVHAEQRRAQAQSRAAELGAKVIEHPDELFKNQAYRHEVSGADIARHAKEGNLVIAPATRYSGSDKPRYYAVTVDNSKQEPSPQQRQEKAKAKGRRDSQRSRIEALAAIVVQKPSAADLRHQLTLYVVEGLDSNNDTMRLAKKIADIAGVGPEPGTDVWDWYRQLRDLSDPAKREQAAWLVSWAARESRHHGSTNYSPWGERSTRYYADLARLGNYKPGEWEQQQLDKARKAAAKEAAE